MLGTYIKTVNKKDEIKWAEIYILQYAFPSWSLGTKKSLSSNSNFENKNIDQIIQTFTVNKIYLDDVLEFGKSVA